VVTTAQLANTTALTTAVGVWRGEVRARHKTTKIATITAAVNATITTQRKDIDMIGPHLAFGKHASLCADLAQKITLP
jgi:hypothetical protein